MNEFRFIKCKDKRYHRGVSYVLAAKLDSGYRVIGLPHQYFSANLYEDQVEEVLPEYKNFKIIQETYLPKDFCDHQAWINTFKDVRWEYGVYVGNIQILRITHEYSEISCTDRFSCNAWYPNFDSRKFSKNIFEFLNELDVELSK